MISYPRTNSNYVNEQNIEGMHKALHMLKSTSYASMAEGADPSRVHINNKAVCNPQRVEDHHAILPTLKRPGTLSKEEQHIYDLVILRFLSHFYPPAMYKQHTVLTEVEGETFKTGIKELLSLGWKVLIAQDKEQKKAKSSKKGKEDEEEETQEWNDRSFDLSPDEPVHCKKSEVKEKATQPPKSYTEGTLLKAMESAGKSIEDEALRDAMKDSGLGTPATRAATIERLKKVGYITMQGKRITVTQKGRTAVELIRHAGVELLASPEMTGQWERRLHQISKGEASADVFMQNVQKFTISIINKVSSQRQAPSSLFGGDEDKSKGRGKRSTGKVAAAPRDKEEHTAKRTPKSDASTSSEAPSVRSSLGRCPRPGCEGHIIEGRKGYGCANFKTGCNYVIWKEFAGKQVSHAMLKSLLLQGKTQLLSFKNEDGSTYKGRIVLAAEGNGKLAVQAEDSNEAVKS